MGALLHRHLALVAAALAAVGTLAPSYLRTIAPSHLRTLAPKEYLVYRSDSSIKVDGKLDDSAWQRAPWTDLFVDIEGDAKPLPRFQTRAKMLWDDEFLYVGADLREPHVWANEFAHDAVIFHDPDFEVFIDPNGDGLEYYEFEINARATFWDLFLPKPYRLGGKADNSWEIPGLRFAVYVDGTLNDSRDTDEGWSVELGFPWKAFADFAHTSTPPKPGDSWRINFSRVEWQIEREARGYKKIAGTKEDNWVWSPQGVVNMHVPEKWGKANFAAAR